MVRAVQTQTSQVATTNVQKRVRTCAKTVMNLFAQTVVVAVTTNYDNSQHRGIIRVRKRKMSDTTDDLEYGIDLWFDESSQCREEKWRKGEHTTKDGTTMRIKDMETSHIENTIRHFDHLDTRPLKRELKRRL